MKSILKILFLVFIGNCYAACKSSSQQRDNKVLSDDVLVADSLPQKIAAKENTNSSSIITGTILPNEIVSFAKTLVGVPYLYASIDPAKGFDCSGFITYVFNHFNIKVPRTSVDFTNDGLEVTEMEAAPGDLILFTGTDSTIRIVGHMGIVESNKDGKLLFIHSTSGNAKGVVITPFEKYYRSRFVKFIRVFPKDKF